MSLPVHKNPSKEPAKAPYNFVPLPEKVVTFDPQMLPDQGRFYPERHTGSIECTITTESPVYVRAPLTPEEFDRQETAQDAKAPWRQQVRNKADFFATDPDKTPRIPGSSLRGMLRQLVEMVSYSKVQWVSGDSLVYRSVGETTTQGDRYRDRVMRSDGSGGQQSGKTTKFYTPLVKAGYIKDERGKYYIRPAQEIQGTTFARIRIGDIPVSLKPIQGCQNAQEIWFRPGPYEYQDVRGGFLRIKRARVLGLAAHQAPGLIQGALARSGAMNSKRTEAVVYPPDLNAQLLPIQDDLVAVYKDQVSQEQEKLLGKEGVLRDGQPIFYLVEHGQLVFFGHTMMMRLPYPYTPIDFVPEQLRRESDLDLAEAIFGYTKSTGEGKARAYASRVLVGDGLLEPGQSDIWLSQTPIVPKILGSPKPTTFQHYLTQQTPDPGAKNRRDLSDYTDPRKSVIRGHKRYWHRGKIVGADIQEASERLKDERGREKEQDTQHTQIRPVRAGVRFRWRLEFENLSDAELGALLWALRLPGALDKQYRHSLGMGKPFGMGAVQIDAGLTLGDRQRRYRALFDGDQWCEGSVEASARIDEFIAVFDKLIRSQIGAVKQARLSDIERIQMLLRMLEWPGPDKGLTEYMQIEQPVPGERNKKNEYKGRPVLPDPLHIDLERMTEHTTRQSSSVPSAQRGPSVGASQPGAERKSTSAQNPSVEKPAARQEPELCHPASIEEIQPGMYLEGRVVRVESNRVVVEICGQDASLTKEHIEPPSHDMADLEERFPVGKIIRVFAGGMNQKGRLQLRYEESL